MDSYMILSIMIVLVVMAAVIAAARIYQKVRLDTGYHQGRFYRLLQHMGAFMGNHHMNKLGMENEDGRIETDEEMFYFSDSSDIDKK